MRAPTISWGTAAAVVALVTLFPLSIASDQRSVPATTRHLPQRQPPADAPSHVTAVTLEQCLVSLIKDVEVPAEEAGVLAGIDVVEGAAVEEGQLLAQVEDARARVQKRIATFAHQAAAAEAQSDVDVRFAKAQEEVSIAEHAEAVAANRLSAGAVAPTEVRRLELTAKRSTLGIEQAEMQYEVAGITEKLRKAELSAAHADVLRRRILAPIGGTVLEVHKHAGEWVQAGEPVLRLARMDRLRVECFVNAAALGDEEVIDCTVQVVVPRQRGQTASFNGEIVFVNPVIEASGNYRVWAEVENRKRSGRWLLRPGMEATMTIELKEPIPAMSEKRT